jgi:hypothetical protein
MPVWVKGDRNEYLWDKAKKIVKKEYSIGEDDDDFWKLVVGVYKKSGGDIVKNNEAKRKTVSSILDSLRSSRVMESLSKETFYSVLGFDYGVDEFYVRYDENDNKYYAVGKDGSYVSRLHKGLCVGDKVSDVDFSSVVFQGVSKDDVINKISGYVDNGGSLCSVVVDVQGVRGVEYVKYEGEEG